MAQAEKDGAEKDGTGREGWLGAGPGCFFRAFWLVVDILALLVVPAVLPALAFPYPLLCLFLGKEAVSLLLVKEARKSGELG